MTHNIAPTVLTNGEYSRIDENNALVKITQFTDLFNTPLSATISLSLVIVNGQNGTAIKTVTAQKIVTQSDLGFEFLWETSFSLSTLPTSVKVHVIGSISTGSGRSTIINTTADPKTILLSGTQPPDQEPTPNNKMVIVDVDSNFIFNDNQLFAKIVASKTQEFPIAFNSDNLQIVWNMFDINNNSIRNGTFDFNFGSNETITRDLIRSNIPEKSINLVVAVTRNNVFLSGSTIVPMVQSEIPLPPPTDDCPEGLHLENGICVPDVLPPEPPTEPPTEPPQLPLNICFTVLLTDGNEQQFSLTDADFNQLISIQQGTPSDVIIKNNVDCDTQANTLQEVLDFIALAPKDEDFVLDTMVSISPNQFIINPEGNLVGEIIFIANTAFNPFWYSKDILFSLQALDANDIPLNDIFKTNKLNFTETQRDERIFIDQSAKNRTRFTVELFVTPSLTDLRNFAPPKRLMVDLEGQQDTTPKTESGFMKALKGALFASVALTLLGSKK